MRTLTPRPNSPYSASKATADLICRAYFITYGLRVVITRRINNYGLYQHPEKFIPTIILNALTSKPIPVYGDGPERTLELPHTLEWNCKV